MIEQFDKIVREQLEYAFKKFDVKISPNCVNITYDLKGKTAGRASQRNIIQLGLEFNKEAIASNYDDMVKNTIPHEIAHLIAFVRPEFGAKGHNKVWKKICIILGGNGERCCSYGLTSTKNVRKFLYEVNGNEYTLGLTRHKRMLQGVVYVCPCGGKINSERFVREL
jgi:SprT protein